MIEFLPLSRNAKCDAGGHRLQLYTGERDPTGLGQLQTRVRLRCVLKERRNKLFKKEKE